MNIEITPEETGGEIKVPPSKSISHRAILAASLANGTSRIKHVLLSDDIRATIEAAKDFGASFEVEPEEGTGGLYTLLITGTPNPSTHDVLIDCGESGSTLRFILPIIALDATNTVVIASIDLSKRPIDAYFDIFERQGFFYEKGRKILPLILEGQLKPGDFELPGDVSSQLVTGLMFALPLLEGDSRIILTSDLESKPYVGITIEVLNEFGIEIERVSPTEYFVRGNQNYRPSSMSVPGDFSQAAFWFANGLINGKTALEDLREESTQGDFEIVEIINQIGGNIYYDQNRNIWFSEPSKSAGFRLDVSDIPDLVPILSVVAALSSGESEFYHAKRLRYKESDRINSTAQMLRNFGVRVEEREDGLKIYGTNGFRSAEIDSFNDHRIAMAAAIASGRADGPVVIKKAQCVSKSYPNFWIDFELAGGKFHGIDLG